jgi:hypothetical protein
MVTCIFCGLRRPGSEEDVISKWIRRTLNPATAHRGGCKPAPGFDKGTLARTLIGFRGQVASLPDRPASLRALAPCQIPAPSALSYPGSTRDVPASLKKAA